MSEQMTEKKEDWMNAKWRPMMGWMYMLVCTMDFVAFPVLWSLINAAHSGSVGSQWSPITLQGAGLFHMAMGAIIGVAAFGRTQEKIAGANNGGAALPAAPSFGSPAPSFGSPAPSFGTPAPSYNAPAPSFGSPAPSYNFPSQDPAPMTVSSNGKAGPAQPQFPVL